MSVAIVIDKQKDPGGSSGGTGFEASGQQATLPLRSRRQAHQVRTEAVIALSVREGRGGRQPSALARIIPEVADHSIRLVVGDDLKRSRLTVLFRLILAIPHFIWLFLWGIAAVVAAVVGWFAALVSGRLPDALHRFLAAYVRYATHFFAYLYLAANPWPAFTGEAGSYPVDLEIDPPVRQSRWKTAFRLILALPAFMLAAVLIGGGPPGGGGGGRQSTEDEGWAYEFGASVGGIIGGVAGAAAFLGWFVCLVRAQMPSGFRDLVVWTLRYAAQTYGYLFLLTDRYPNSDPYEIPALRPERRLAVRLFVRDDLRRSRLTVFFRLLLALPHLVWLTLWGIVAFLAAILNWIVTLVAGRSLLGLHRFLAAFVRYQAHVTAFLSLAANPFPGFVGERGYPVEVEIDEPRRQHRLITLFRLVLAFPALLVSSALSLALWTAAIFGWFASLALGRMPAGLRNVCAYAIHYTAQFDSYIYLLTERYPYSGPVRGTEPPEEAVEPEVARPWPPAASEAA
jgi:hypothetical protein